MPITEQQPYRVVLPAPYVHNEWLRARVSGIGGSDAAAILGLSRYKSALEVWQEKTGRLPVNAEQVGPDDVRWWGLALEDDISAAFRETTGLDTAPSPGMLAHVERDWQYANPDGFVRDAGTGEPLGLLEIKTTGLHGAADWTEDNVPVGALLQVQHYLAVTGLRHAWIAGLIAGQRFVIREVDADDELIGMLVDREHAFWQHVLDDTPPRPDGSASAGQALRREYPVADDDDGVVLDAEALRALATYRDLDRRITELEAARAHTRQLVQAALGSAPAGWDGERRVVRWSNVTAHRLDGKALEAAYPDIAAQFKRETTTRRFTVEKE